MGSVMRDIDHSVKVARSNKKQTDILKDNKRWEFSIALVKHAQKTSSKT